MEREESSPFPKNSKKIRSSLTEKDRQAEAVEDFKKYQFQEKQRTSKIWTSSDFLKRNYNPLRPIFPSDIDAATALVALSDRERTAKILSMMSLTEETLIPYPTLDKDDPDIDAKIDRIKVASDFRYFCDSFLKIEGKNQQVIDFKLNPIQLFFIFNRTGYDIINKGRQHGFTTLMLAYYLWISVTNNATVTFIITHKKKATKKMISKIRGMWECLPDSLRPALLIDSAEHLKFATGSEIQCEVNDVAAGRSFTCNNMLCSEVAFWDIDDDKMHGLFESVPKGGSVTLESTPNGVGNFFHRECEHALNPHEESAYKLFEIPWYLNPEYNEQWRIWKQKRIKFHTEKGKITWYQEYCCSFEQSQRRFFAKEDCAPKSLYRKRLTEGPHGIVPETGEIIIKPYPEYLYVYREPIPGHTYVIGADVAKGLEHGDFSSATVIDRETREEVAHVYGKPKPEKYAAILNWLGRRYGGDNGDAGALLAVEAQQDGLTVLSLLYYDYNYKNIFYHLDPLAMNRDQRSPPIGWQQNRRTRRPMLNKFEKDVREKVTLLAFWIRQREMEIFTKAKDGKPQAPPKMNDDTIISGAIANAILDYDDMIEDESPELELKVA